MPISRARGRVASLISEVTIALLDASDADAEDPKVARSPAETKALIKVMHRNATMVLPPKSDDSARDSSLTV
jgi:hypothetical protein